MKKERKDETIQEFTGPLWDDHPKVFGDRADLEELVNTPNENPDYFREEWVGPLLAEGLDFYGILDLLLKGTARPN